MPIEIRELIISANVDTQKGASRKGKMGGKGAKNRQVASTEATIGEVMRLLRKKMER